MDIMGKSPPETTMVATQLKRREKVKYVPSIFSYKINAIICILLKICDFFVESCYFFTSIPRRFSGAIYRKLQTVPRLMPLI